MGLRDQAHAGDHRCRAAVHRKDIFFLCHGGPINTPEDAERVLGRCEAVGFVGASSLERMGVEESLTGLTRRFKAIDCPAGSRESLVE